MISDLVALESDRKHQCSAVGTMLVNVQPDVDAVVDRVDLMRDGATSCDRIAGSWMRMLSMAMDKLQSSAREPPPYVSGASAHGRKIC